MRKSSRGWRFFMGALLAILAVLALAACQGGQPGGELASQQALRVWLDGEPQYIDPSKADFAAAVAIAKNTHATLLRFDPLSGQLLPYVAEQVPTRENGGISEDGLTYTYRISEGAVWEDGTPITAQQFVYSIYRLLDPRVASYYGTSYYSAFIEGGEELAAAVEAGEDEIEQLRQKVGVRALDERTLEVRINQPSGTFNFLMSLWPAAALRQDVIERYGDISNSQWTEAGNLVASGPFRLAEWQHGDHITLERNPNFWLKDMTPTLERITFQIIEDENTAFAAYRAGQLDAVEVPLAQMRSLAADSELGQQLIRVPKAATDGIAFNLNRSPFDKREDRLAFCQALDRETLVNEIRQGRGHATTAFLPPDFPPFSVEARGSELAFDVEKARANLAAGGSGQDFPSLSFTYANTAPLPDQATFLQQQWKTNLGLDIKLQPLDPAAFQDAFIQADYDMAWIGWGEDYHHAENWLVPWRTGGILTLGGYSNPEYDTLVDQALAEADLEAAAALWRQAEELLIDQDVPFCPLVNDESAWLVKPYVRDFIITPADNLEGDYYYYKTAVLEH